MDFSLTEEQQMFRDLFAEFAAKEVAPQAAALDAEERPPLAALQKAAQQGFLGAPLPEAYGGAGLDMLGYTLLLEALGRACLSTAFTVHTHTGLAALTVLRHGTEEQKERYLPALAAGERTGAFALTEPEAGSDFGNLRTRARREGDSYVLDGTKTWVANGEIAGLFVIFACTEGGVTPFLIEREANGLTVGRRERTLGLRGLALNPLYLEGCRVLVESRLGAEGEGLAIARAAQDRGRLSVAAMSLGAAQATLDLGITFALQRKQFGVFIAEKQAIQNYLADSSAEIAALRHLVDSVAWKADQGGDYTQDAAIAKLFGSQVALRVANRMVQVHGGAGYMKDYPIERWFRDARALDIAEGPGLLQRAVIAREMLAEKGIAVVA
ncbi:MAG: acyl-CoA dehydrogenase family protein [Anaerolineae bacterium]|nr:acyl-CoA dehydrogenase family protein [Anaerolineae bacterium]